MTAIDLRAELRTLQQSVEALQQQVERLDHDLDESRRLNLRAAELLDMVYEFVGARSI